MKKIISFAVALVMLLSCFIISTSAEGAAPVDLIDSMEVIVKGTEEISGQSPQSVTNVENGIFFMGPQTGSGDAYTRALCKINGDDGVDLTGYTYIYVDIEFDGVTDTGDSTINSRFMIGDKNAIEYLPINKITDSNGNEIAYGNDGTHDLGVANGCKYYNTVPLPQNLGNKYTLTFQIKIPVARVNTVVNRFFAYPGGSNGITTGDMTMTSVRLGGDTDPGVISPEIPEVGNDLIENIGVQTQGGASLLNSMSVIDAQAEKISGNTSQSVDKNDSGIIFKGPNTTGGNAYPRALCKINGDDGVDLTGYTYVYFDIEFDGVTPTNQFRTSFYVGDKSAVDQMPITKITDSNGNEITYGTDGVLDGVNNYKAYPAPTNLGSNYTLTFRAKIPTARANTTINRMFVYAGGWEGINSGNMTLTSVRLGGDTDPGTEMSARFISVLRDADLSKYTEVGFEVTAALGETSNTQVASGNTVYTSVIGAGDEYTPDLFGGNYFAALRIDNVPATEGLTFTVRAYVKTVDGETIWADAVTYTVSATGTIS